MTSDKRSSLRAEPLPLDSMPKPQPIELVDYIESLGEIAVGTRMKRLAEKLFPTVDALYQDTGIPFRAHWFALFRLLMTADSMSIGEIADRLRITHVAVQKQAKELLQTGLVDSRPDKDDKRKRLLFLTTEGHQAVARFAPIWTAVEHHLHQLLQEAHPDFLGLIKTLENYAETEFTTAAIRRDISGSANCNVPLPVRLVDYRPEFRSAFYELNKQWLDKYFGGLEKADIESLENPGEYFLKDGGFVFFALVDEKPVGTIALRYIDPEHYELCKLAVDETMQGLGIGRKLIHRAIMRARTNGAEYLSLYTNSTLKSAQKLYEKHGFKDIPFNPRMQSYSRVNTRMVLRLQHRRLDEEKPV